MDESCTQTIPTSEGTGSEFHARFRDCRENQNGELDIQKEKPAAFMPGKNEGGQILMVVLAILWLKDKLSVGLGAEVNRGLQNVLEKA